MTKADQIMTKNITVCNDKVKPNIDNSRSLYDKEQYDKINQYCCYSTPHIDKCTLHHDRNQKITSQNYKNTSQNVKSPLVMEIVHHIMSKTNYKKILITQAHHTMTNANVYTS